MRDNQRLRVAVQKSGRLSEKSLALFAKCGLDFDLRKDRLLHECKEFPIDLMLVRDDDIPAYVADGVCDLGVVGENAVHEHLWAAPQRKTGGAVRTLLPLGFGACHLALAVPEGSDLRSVADFAGKRVATSYPHCLTRFMAAEGVEVEVVELAGSVEIATGLGIADAICDLVSSGATLRSNGLEELLTILESQAVLIRSDRALTPAMEHDLQRLLQRIQGVLKAARAKYVMMNAPRSALEEIRRVIPGMEDPSVMPLGSDGSKIAIHAVAYEEIFWDTIETLQRLGASSILVLPIEKVIA